MSSISNNTTISYNNTITPNIGNETSIPPTLRPTPSLEYAWTPEVTLGSGIGLTVVCILKAISEAKMNPQAKKNSYIWAAAAIASAVATGTFYMNQFTA